MLPKSETDSFDFNQFVLFYGGIFSVLAVWFSLILSFTFILEYDYEAYLYSCG